MNAAIAAIDGQVDVLHGHVRQAPDVDALFASCGFSTTDRRKLTTTKTMPDTGPVSPGVRVRRRAHLLVERARRRLPPAIDNRATNMWAQRQGDGVRRAVPADVDAIYALGAPLLDWPCETAQFTRGSVRWAVERHGRFCIVAIVDGRLAGFALAFLAQGVAFQTWSARDPDLLGQGTGIAMNDTQTEAFEAAGVREIASHTRDLHHMTSRLAEYDYFPNGEAYVDIEYRWPDVPADDDSRPTG